MVGRLRRKTDIKVLAGLISLAFIMRFCSFFPTIISHDEATFFVIAREIFLGKIYFVDLVDTKPPGIFIILGLFIKYISSSIFMLRAFSAFVVGLTAYIIYLTVFFDTQERKPAVAGGVIFILFMSIWAFFGVFITPELFYVFFTALAFYIFTKWKKPGGFITAGLLVGIGFILKYLVVFDLAAWLLFYFVTGMFTGEKDKKGMIFLNCVLAGLAFLVPFAAVTLYYYSIGHLKEFLYYTFTVSSRFPEKLPLIGKIIYVGDFHLRFLPLVFFFYYVFIREKGWKGAITKPLISVWCLFVLVAIILPGRPFGHYFIQMMLPFSIYAGRFFRKGIGRPVWLGKITSHPYGTALLAVFIISMIIVQKKEYCDKPDYPKQVAEYLKPLLSDEDRIYTGNYQHVLYYLLEKDCPVRYVHRTILCDAGHLRMFDIDQGKELEGVLKGDFRFIIMQGPYCYEPMNVYIAENYRLIKTFDGDIYIYEKR
jgi:4-amino-4-deoxy-L-arabinose transferase-like glycosyltransferase